LRRFFVKVAGGFQIAKSLREMCVFARQDLAQDLRSRGWTSSVVATCSSIWGRLSKRKIMSIFHYALKPTGFLMQGKSESISGVADSSR